MWTCHVKKELRSPIFSEAFVNLGVATPYSLSMDIPRQLKFTNPSDPIATVSEDDVTDMDVLKNVTWNTERESQYASCSAASVNTHAGGIDPHLTWFVNGVELKNVSMELLQKLVSVVDSFSIPNR